MSYKYYAASSSIIVDPGQTYINDLQAKMNDDFKNTTDYFLIQEELTVGQQDWSNTDVHINHIIDANTGDKLGDDFRSLTFMNMNHPYGMGRRYQFDNNIWVTVNSDFYHYPTASTVIRRCNNTLNFYVNGILVKEPCIIDYKPYRNSILNSKVITLQEGRIYVITQNNQNTKTILENQRFLFGGRAFKTIYVDNYLLNTTFDKDSAPLIEFYMDINQINPAIDNVTDNIAGAYSQNVTMSSNVISSNTPELIKAIDTGDSQAYTVYNYNSSGVQTTDKFTIIASGVPTNYYTLTTTDNGFTVGCTQMYANNPLTITCTNQTDNTTVQILIQLKGLF